MKKLIISILCLVMILSAAPIVSTAANADKYGVLTLPEDDGSGYPPTGINQQFHLDNDIFKVIIPENIIRLGENAFYLCGNLSTIEVHSKLQAIGKKAFTGTKYYNTEENWENGVLYLEDCLIKADPEVIGEAYEVKKGTRLIASGAFEGCQNLKKIALPATIEFIGEDAFADTAFYNDETNWENGILYLGNTVIDAKEEEISGKLTIKQETSAIAENAFALCNKITDIELPDSLINVGSDAFYNCDNLKTVHIGSKIETLGRAPFRDCEKLQKITVQEENPFFTVIDGILYDKDLTSVVRCPQKTSGKVVLPDTVKRINAFAFDSCTLLERVSIPHGCIFVGQCAFAYCEKLEKIVLPQTMEFIDQKAFSYCSNLIYADVPDSTINLGESAFEFCKSLESITLGDGITEINSKVFESCEKLNSVKLGDYVTKISSSFEGTKLISDIFNYYNGMLIISNKYLINVSTATVDCTIPGGVTVVADFAFSDAADSGNLKSITLPSSVKSFSVSGIRYSPHIKIYYKGNLTDLYGVIDHNDLRALNLYTTDYYLYILAICALCFVVIAFVVGIFIYNNDMNSFNRKRKYSGGFDYDLY